MSKYRPLGEYLEMQTANCAKLSFAQIEQILGQALPPSASRHRAWWANELRGQHVQARAWLDAGWQVEFVDLTGRWATFARSS